MDFYGLGFLWISNQIPMKSYELLDYIPMKPTMKPCPNHWSRSPYLGRQPSPTAFVGTQRVPEGAP
jgi:hypothetical protein